VVQFRSITSRIIILHMIAVGIASILMPVALYWRLNSETQNLHNRAMREQADSIAQHLVLRIDGSWALDLPPGLQDLYSSAYGRYAYAVLDGTGHVLFSSLDERMPVFPADSRLADVAFLEARPGGATISGASVPKAINGRTIWVQVAENLAHRDVLIDDIVADFVPRVGWIMLPILLSLLAIDIVIFRRALRPLVRASEQAQNISPARTDIRLPVDELPNEIRPLVLAVNRALDRLEEGFRVQREFTADAAHELRTPLTILRTRIETLVDNGLTQELHQDIEGMSRIVSQLLDIAELDTFLVDPCDKADLQQVSAQVAEFVAPLALTQGKNIALSAENGPIWVRGNEEMLHRAIRNLVENAINHTPQGTVVEIVLGKNGTVSILDEGPGIPLAERELIFQRFWRRDRRRTGNAGLGLSIVQRIAEAYTASIKVENRPTGGAQFSLTFIRAELGTFTD
jgi:signal transduction histidine kinase